jgi:pimeloyl-ACP methyl ester carboxylesterase
LKTALTLSAAVGLIYLLIVAFYALLQRGLIYYPATVSMEQARQQAMALGGAPWQSSEGQWLGWKIEPRVPTPRSRHPRALVFHGNAGMALHRSYYADLLTGFSLSGPWAIYIAEYPGYGPRDGTPDQATLVAAAVNAVDELLTLDPEPLLVVGESLGSGVASALAHERPDAVAALLLVTPFDSMVSVASHHMPWLPAGLLLRDRYDNREALTGFSKPLVVVTAEKDEIVPAKLAEPLLWQHSGPTLHESQGAAGHNTLHFNPRHAPWPAVDGFLAAAWASALQVAE